MVMKICYITGQLGVGGAEKQLALLAAELVRRRHSVQVVNFHGERGDFWERPLAESGVNVVAFPAGTSRLARLRMLWRLLSEWEAQVVHSWTFSANPYASLAGRAAGVPLRFGSERSNHHYSLPARGRVGYRLCLAGLDGLVANSAGAAEFIRAYAPGLRVHCVPNAIVSDVDETLGQRRSEARRWFGLAPGEIAIAGVGSLSRNKNFAALLRAAASLTADFQSVRVVLIGDGPERGRLEELARELRMARPPIFAGLVPDAARLMPGFEIVCLPAVGFEGLPNVLLEAAAAGVPALASSVGGAREVVVAGETGLVYDERDDDGLRAGLRQLVADASLRRAMGQAGLRRAREHFGLDRMVDAMLSIYEFRTS